MTFSKLLPSSRFLDSAAAVQRNHCFGFWFNGGSRSLTISSIPKTFPIGLRSSSGVRGSFLPFSRRFVYQPVVGMGKKANNGMRSLSSSSSSHSQSKSSSSDEGKKEENVLGPKKLSPEEPVSGAATPTTTTPGNQTTSAKLKQAVKDYGATVIVFHVSMSLVSLGFFYLLVTSGLDIGAILQKLGVDETIFQNKITQGASTFVIAYAVHKIFAPVRLGITLTATPFIVRKLRNIGFLKKPPTV